MKYQTVILPSFTGIVAALMFLPVANQAQGRISTPMVEPESTQRQLQRTIPPKAERRVTLRFDDTSLDQVLKSIAQQSGIDITYAKDIVVGKKATVHLDSATVYGALRSVLNGTGLSINVFPSGNVSVVQGTPEKQGQTVGLVTGIVVDSATKKGIAKATVKVVGTKLSAVTSDAGYFVLRGVDPGKHIIDVKLFGYRSASIPVEVSSGEETKTRVILAAIATSLSEVVTTATGLQRKVEVGNDITTIDVPAIIEKNPVSSVTDLLATRVPGLVVGRASGEPGARSEIRIRGTNSLRASMEPIVIVDGVQVIGDRAILDTVTTFGNPPSFATSPIDQLDVNAIDKIEVLKGPSAVALYGSNAANGVIVVTTKRGREGPVSWNAAATVSQETTPGTWPVNYFAWGEDLTNGNGTVHCPRYDQSLVGSIQRPNWGVFPTCRYDSTTVYQILNDPQTTVFGKGIRKDLSMTVSGGSSRITYSFTGTYRPWLGLMKLPNADVSLLEDAGIAPKSWQRRPQALDQYSGMAAITLGINDRSSLTYTTQIMREDKRSTPLVDVLGGSAELAPPVTLYDQNGVPVGGGSGVLVKVPDFMAGQNSNSFRFQNAANYRATFWQTLTLETTAGVDASNGRETYLLATGDYCPLKGSLDVLFGSCFARTDSLARDYRSARTSQLVTDAHFKVSGAPKGFRLLNVTPVMGVDINSNVTGKTGVAAGLLPVGGRGIRGAGVTWVEPEVQAARRTAGVFAQATIKILDRFWLPFSVRRDAGNAIGSRDKTIFPRTALSYLVSDEPTFRNIPVFGRLPELRIRTSFGMAGRQPGLADKYRTYTYSRFPIENVDASVVNLYSVGNTKLSPEIARDLEMGFDVTMVERSRGRLSGGVTFSRLHTSNLIMDENLPPSLGEVDRRVSNIGDAENSNLDVTLEGFKRVGLFDWNTSNVFSTGKGRLVRLKSTYVRFLQADNEGDLLMARVYREGYPINGYWAKPVIGFVDGNGDGLITYNEVVYGDTVQYLGTPTPRFTLTSNNTITIASRFTITATVTYDGGGTAASRAQGANLYKYSREMNDPTLSLEDQVKFRYDPTSWAHKVSTLRFQSMQLTYNMSLSQRYRLFGARSLQVAVSGTNLGLWSTFSGKDPGVGGIGRNANQTVLPISRFYGISLRVQ